MNKKEYMAYHLECCTKMHEITKKKNADYTGETDDPFFNFSRVEAVGIASTEQGFLTRMIDKISRITTFAQKGVLLVADESIEDTLLDLSNYCILMSGYIKSKKDKAKINLDKQSKTQYSQQCQCKNKSIRREVKNGITKSKTRWSRTV